MDELCRARWATSELAAIVCQLPAAPGPLASTQQ